MVVDFLASLSFYLVPYLLGRFFSKNIAQAYLLGALLWFVFLLLAGAVFSFFNLVNFSFVIRLIATIVSAISLIDIGVSFRKNKTQFNLTNYLPALSLIIFGSLVYFLIWKRSTPYPLQLSWDNLEHIALANQIYLGKISFLTSRISDTFTFNSYSSMFGVLLALPKILFEKSLIGIYWWLEYWHYLLTILASYLVAKKLFNNTTLAVAAGVLSSLIFESLIVYCAFFLIPQTFSALLTVFVLINIKEYKPAWLILTCLAIFLLHYVVGLVCVATLAFVYVSNKVNPKDRLLNLGIIAAALFALLFSLVNFVGKWNSLSVEEAAHFNFPLSTKFGFFTDWYGLILLVSVIGFLVILREKNRDLKVFSIVALLLFGLSLAPFSYFLKFFVLGRYFINIVLLGGLGYLVSGLPRLAQTLAFGGLTFVLLITFYLNQLAYKDPLHYKNYETQVSYQEIKAGNFLATEFKDTKTFLISDPSLSAVLEATGEINTQGGAYMSESSRKTFSDAQNLSDSEKLKAKLLTIEDKVDKDKEVVLFAVGGRYFDWQRLPKKERESTFYNIWSPRLIKDQDKPYVDFLKTSQDFRLIYENNEIVIFRIL